MMVCTSYHKKLINQQTGSGHVASVPARPVAACSARGHPHAPRLLDKIIDGTRIPACREPPVSTRRPLRLVTERQPRQHWRARYSRSDG